MKTPAALTPRPEARGAPSQGPIVLCIGTRPEIIKLAPVYHAMRAAGLPVVVLHTGQHRDMAWPVYDFFKIVPDHCIDLVRKSDSLAHLSALLLEKLHEILEQLNPSVVLVQGDTTSALMAALAAFYCKVPVGHVEAGLRTHTMYDPFPEEKNRELIARIARWHFAPSEQARINLVGEGIGREHIAVVGNTVIDAAHWGLRQVQHSESAGEHDLPAGIVDLARGQLEQNLILVTAHRRENWGAGIRSIAAAIKEILETDSGISALWPVHGNIKVSSAVREVFAGLEANVAKRLHVCEPLSYPALLWALQTCKLVLTDSGGIQEEAAALHKPVLVLRYSTQRVELVASGGALLVGTDRRAIVSQTLRLLSDAHAYRLMAQAGDPFGDGGGVLAHL